MVCCAVAACSSVPATLPAGMTFSDEPLPGKVVWNDLITEDLPAAKRFYGGLFGWTFEDTRTRNGADYAIASDGDVFVAGLIEALGGQVLVAPDPNLREGTMAIITDPTGALLVLQKT